jgi:hypothetical protein
MTDHTENNTDRMTDAELEDRADKMFRIVVARRDGDMPTASRLLAELAATPDGAFTLILGLARTAAWPAIQAKKLYARSGRQVEGIIPMDNGDLTGPEREALTLVAMFATDEKQSEANAFASAAEIVMANNPGRTQRVITTLVDILAQDGPRIRAFTSPFGSN